MDAQSNETGFIPLEVEFTGGLEILFSNQRNHNISLPGTDEKGRPATAAFLVRYLCEYLMKDTRKEMFIMDGTVRPGILVLINNADWELEGGDLYELRENDNIFFISTLHGG